MNYLSLYSLHAPSQGWALYSLELFLSTLIQALLIYLELCLLKEDRILLTRQS